MFSKQKASALNKVKRGVDTIQLADEIFELLRDKNVTAYEATQAWEFVENRIKGIISHRGIEELIELNKMEEITKDKRGNF